MSCDHPPLKFPRPLPTRVLVEVCPTLHLQRNVEDHESVVEVFNAWPPNGDYLFHLRLDPEKFALFVKPDVSNRGL